MTSPNLTDLKAAVMMAAGDDRDIAAEALAKAESLK
jgi:hypothetical protein